MTASHPSDSERTPRTPTERKPYETECGECGTRLRVTNNFSPMGDFLDQSIQPIIEAESEQVSLDVERLGRVLRDLAESFDPEYGSPLDGLAYDDLASSHAARLIIEGYARLSPSTGTPALTAVRLQQAMIRAGLGVPVHDADPIEVTDAQRVIDYLDGPGR